MLNIEKNPQAANDQQKGWLYFIAVILMQALIILACYFTA